MAFLLEFTEHLIRRSMEDPKERDEKSRSHLYELKDKSEKLKATWAQPVKPYGFWTQEAHHQKYVKLLFLLCLKHCGVSSLLEASSAGVSCALLNEATKVRDPKGLIVLKVSLHVTGLSKRNV